MKKIIKYHLPLLFINIIFYFSHRFFMLLFLKILKLNGLKLTGKPRYIGNKVVFDDLKKITLGDRVVISNDCHFLTHDYSLTTALISIGEKPSTDVAFIREIVVNDNVFIGKKTMILPGTIIGKNTIIGAGSVVRGKLLPNSIYIGNPAEKISELKAKALLWKEKIDLNPNNIKRD